MKKLLPALLLLCVLYACKKGTSPAPADLTLGTAALAFPLKSEPCLSGTILSATQNTVTFKWSAARNATSYDVLVKNLIDGTNVTQTTAQAELAITLTRNTPYAWSVVSRSLAGPATTTSEVWKFFNSGPGIVYYAPYPAEAVTPTNAQTLTISNGKVALDWNGTDADDDIVAYDLYFGVSTNPALLKADISSSIYSDIPVTANTTYYWKVITKDGRGNRSDSEIFSFKVN